MWILLLILSISVLGVPLTRSAEAFVSPATTARTSSSNRVWMRMGTSKEEALEKSAVQRFTVGYDKLCKNCPTRLQPRVDTLTEMIMGLPVEERHELLAAVARRVQMMEAAAQEQETPASSEEETKNVSTGLRTPKEVYDFQVAGLEAVDPKKDKAKTEKSKKGDATDKTKNDLERALVKAMEKMEKARCKHTENERKLARVNHLLEVTTALLKRKQEAVKAETLQVVAAADDDDDDDEEVSELYSMTRERLKHQQLKYKANKAKLEQSKAKSRSKRYGLSLELELLRKEQQRQQQQQQQQQV